MNNFNKFDLSVFFILILNHFAFSQTATIVTYGIDIQAKVANIEKDSTNRQFEIKAKNLELLAEETDYELSFNNISSVFTKKNMMNIDNSGNRNKFSAFSDGEWYKNLNDTLNIKQKEFIGELFNIHYPMEIHNWRITNESKQISGYLCFRAVASKTEFNVITNKEKVFITEAWFTPEISAPFGPAGIDGLPGLILVCSSNNGSINFYAEQIKFGEDDNVKNTLNLGKGKNISKKDYTELIVQKYKSLRN